MSIKLIIIIIIIVYLRELYIYVSFPYLKNDTTQKYDLLIVTMNELDKDYCQSSNVN